MVSLLTLPRGRMLLDFQAVGERTCHMGIAHVLHPYLCIASGTALAAAHLCGSSQVDVVDTNTGAAHHFQAALGGLEHLACDLQHVSKGIVSGTATRVAYSHVLSAPGFGTDERPSPNHLLQLQYIQHHKSASCRSHATMKATACTHSTGGPQGKLRLALVPERMISASTRETLAHSCSGVMS